MSTQAGDSQKSLLEWAVGYSDFLFDSASDLMNIAGASEMLDAKGRGSFAGTEESFAVGCEGSVHVLRSPPPSIDSDAVLCSYFDDQAIRLLGHGSYAQIDSLDSPLASWGLDISRKLAEASLIVPDVSPRGVLQVSGPSSSGTMGRSRDLRLTAATGRGMAEMPASEIFAGSDVPQTSPSRTTAAGSSVQLSSHSDSDGHDIDGHGFVIVEGLYDRLPPFVHYDPPSDRRSIRRNGKWRTMLINAEDNWAEICQLHSKLLKKRVRKGIPNDWRYRAWPLLTGGRMLQRNNPNVYARLLRSHCDCEEKIIPDLHRTLPRHILFAEADGPGQRSLFNVLKAYAVYDPEVGYVQGMGSLVAPLLLVMSEEDTFWTFASLMREEAPFPRPTTAGAHVGCRRLFLEGLPLTHELMSKLEHLLSETLPRLHRWLHDHDLSCSAFTTKWWMTLFCFVLPFQHVLRVWDIFFLEGWKMALRTGLVILKCMEPQVMRPESEDQILGVLESYNIAQSLPSPDVFIKMALNTRISKILDTWPGSEAEA